MVLIGIHGLADSTAQARQSQPVAKKVADLQDKDYEWYSAMLDNFRDYLKQDKSLHGVVIVYGPEGNLSRGTAYRILRDVTYYLKATATPSDRVTIVNGGATTHAPWTTTELWIVPPGAKTPEPNRQPEPETKFSGQVGTMFGAQSDYDIEIDSPSSYGAPMAAFAQILHRQPGSVGYLIVHQEDGSSHWRLIAKYNRKKMKLYGLDTARVTTIHGKSADQPYIELSVLSKGERLPST